MRRRGAARRGGVGRRGVRRRRRRMRRRTRRLIMGTATILMVGGTAAAYKLNKMDVEKIEKQTGKSADDLTEEELKAAMKRLGIKQLELTDEDEAAMDKADAEDEAKESSHTNTHSSGASQTADPAVLLKQLGDLKEAGILTEEEFATKKAEILSRL